MVYIGRERLVSSPVHGTISSIALKFIPASVSTAINWYLTRGEKFLRPQIFQVGLSETLVNLLTEGQTQQLNTETYCVLTPNHLALTGPDKGKSEK